MNENNKNREVKQVIVFRKDLLKGQNAIRKGKFGAQVAHASIGALMQESWKTHLNNHWKGNVHDIDKAEHDIRHWYFTFAENSPLDIWLNGIFTKIVLGIDADEKHTCDENLVALYEKIKKENPHIPICLITDCGKTEFNGISTNTCIGIGPWWSDEIDVFTKNLSLL